jgi:hypothetical protein
MAPERLARNEDMFFGQLAAGNVARCWSRSTIVMVKLAVVLQKMVSGKVFTDTTHLSVRVRLEKVFAGFADICLLALALHTSRLTDSVNMSSKLTLAEGIEGDAAEESRLQCSVLLDILGQYSC